MERGGGGAEWRVEQFVVACAPPHLLSPARSPPQPHLRLALPPFPTTLLHAAARLGASRGARLTRTRRFHCIYIHLLRAQVHIRPS